MLKSTPAQQRELLRLELQNNRQTIQRTFINTSDAFPRSITMRMLTKNNAIGITTKLSYAAIALSLFKGIGGGLSLAKLAKATLNHVVKPAPNDQIDKKDRA